MCFHLISVLKMGSDITFHRHIAPNSLSLVFYAISSFGAHKGRDIGELYKTEGNVVVL